MCSERQDVSSVLSQLHDKTDGCNQRVQVRKINSSEMHHVIRRSQGDVCFISFYLVLFYCVLFYL